MFIYNVFIKLIVVCMEPLIISESHVTTIVRQPNLQRLTQNAPVTVNNASSGVHFFLMSNGL